MVCEVATDSESELEREESTDIEEIGERNKHLQQKQEQQQQQQEQQTNKNKSI